MEGCIFCRIVDKQIKSEIVYEDVNFLVFKDINPQAPIHFLVVPKKHIENINFIEDDNSLEGIFSVIKKVTKELGLDKDGYRIVQNNGRNAGQAVDHIHFHVLAGRKFGWPPG
ncbi:MAG: histidine triad nucleotide-binding protein [Endomicrobia bacterium]|nr:histidine triad nucleotide-binding protein [Endomicrobiia bacterium]